MQKIITRFLLLCLVSCYFYPIQFTFIPKVNTKMMLAALGLFIFMLKIVRRDKGKIDKDIIFAGFFAFLFSLLCYLSTALNNTYDDSYTTYFSSFFVWTFGGYGVCYFLKKEYKVVDLRLITYYLAVVGVIQVISAQLIASYPELRTFVDRFIQQGQAFLHKVNRSYGLGASLDSGGVRLAITLVLMSFFMVESARDGKRMKEFLMLTVAFVLITVYGNMIARTTTVGAVVGLSYILFDAANHMSGSVKKSRLNSIGAMLLMFGGTFLIFSYLYTTNATVHSNLRFAFEGFFNWVETGEFTTGSTEKLNANMWVWPKDTEGWIIGTGKFGNWAYGTDIGYCRFILYCGLFGFGAFALFFIHNAAAFARKFKDVNMMAIALLALTFIIWMKVSTDIYQIYALLYCADGVVQYNADSTPDSSLKK